ncbi:MAG: adenylate/guanylate cyclase domain-containing protein [Candidatus Kapaibacteriota bacterium]
MITRLRRFLHSDIEIVPPEIRAEFRREMSVVNIRRMSVVSWVIVMANIVFIITIDALNLLHLDNSARIIASIMHSMMLSIALGVIVLQRRFSSLQVEEMQPLHYRMGIILPTLLLVFPTILMYFIVINKANPAAPYAAVLTLWGAGLMIEFRFAVRVILLNNAAFYAMMWYANTQQPINLGLEGFFSVELMTIGVLLGMSLNFRKNAEEFVQRKHIEFERNRIAALNDEIAAAYEEAEVLNTNLANTLRALEHEQQTSERLLLNILPSSIADRMKSGETTIAEQFESVTVLFADIVGFTNLSATLKPQELVSLLDQMFSAFDALAEQHDIEKIKTIGDAYMAVCGVPEAAERHTERMLHFAVDMLRVVEAVNQKQNHLLRIRIGVHTGEVVAGVIGKHKFSYDLWGDTVNTASRMESHGEAGKIHISEEVRKALVNHSSLAIGHGLNDNTNAPMTNDQSTNDFRFEERGEMEIKGKGIMRTYFLMKTL